MTLYEIDQELAALLSATDPETGEWTGDPEAWDRLNLERKVKIENTGCYIKNLRADAEAVKAQAEILMKEATARMEECTRILNRARRLERMLFDSLQGENFESSRCTLRFKKNNPKVVYDNLADTLSWAREYAPECIKEAPPTLSTEAVKKRLKAGEAVPGASLVQEMRLEVK